MNRIKITNNQLMVITAIYICGFALFEITSGVTTIAVQDSWISATIAIAFGLPFLWLVTKLGSLYPNKSYVEIIQLLLGKWLGGLVSFAYVFYCFVCVSQFTWYISGFFNVFYLIETPSEIINIVFLVSTVIALLYGLEAIARASEVVFYILFVIFILFVVMLTPNLNFSNLLPMLEKGFIPVAKGAFLETIATSAQLFMLLMIFSKNISNIKEGKKALLKGYIIGMIAVLLLIILGNLVLGTTIASNSRYPIFMLSKAINVGVILSRVEAIMIFIWLATSFISTIIYFYPIAEGMSQILKLNNSKNIIVPIGLLLAVFSKFIYKNVPYKIYWDSYVFMPFEFTFGFVLPFVLLTISWIKGNNKAEVKNEHY